MWHTCLLNIHRLISLLGRLCLIAVMVSSLSCGPLTSSLFPVSSTDSCSELSTFSPWKRGCWLPYKCVRVQNLPGRGLPAGQRYTLLHLCSYCIMNYIQREVAGWEESRFVGPLLRKIHSDLTATWEHVAWPRLHGGGQRLDTEPFVKRWSWQVWVTLKS